MYYFGGNVIDDDASCRSSVIHRSQCTILHQVHVIKLHYYNLFELETFKLPFLDLRKQTTFTIKHMRIEGKDCINYLRCPKCLA
jgi:hypothetical protein